MKKKLLIFIDTLRPMVDGVSMFLDNTVGILSQKYEVTIIAPRYSTEPYENTNLITFPVRRLPNLDYGLPKNNRKIIKNEVKKCDFILNHESLSPYTASFFGLLYAKKYKKPFFTYIHSIDFELSSEIIKIPNFIRKIEKTLLQIYARWFLNNETATVVSFPTIKKILKNIKVKGSFEIVPIGITDIFKPGKSKYSLQDKIVIGFVGRISREKGLDVLLEVYLKLKEKYQNLFLFIVGDGPLRATIEVHKDVNITGFISHQEVADYYRAMDIFVLPSLTEANSLSTLEALKSGACCITNEVGAIGDYLKDGFNGFFIHNKEELYAVLEKLIQDEKLRKTTGINATKSVADLTWGNTTNKLIKVFEKYL